MLKFKPSQIKKRVETISEKIDFLKKEYEKNRQLESEIKNLNSKRILEKKFYEDLEKFFNTNETIVSCLTK